MSKFKSTEVVQKLIDFPIVPLYYHSDADLCKQIVKACYDGGVRVFEFTNRGPAALTVFKQLCNYVHQQLPEMALGIGTVFNSHEAQQFIDAGADLIIQPITNEEVATVCKKNNLAWIPAAGTLTEIYTAQQMGASVVKLFPGNVYGTGFIKALRGPMPDVKIMVTGGVEPTVESVKEWFEVGANAVGLGSKLFTNISNDSGRLSKLTETLTQLFK